MRENHSKGWATRPSILLKLPERPHRGIFDRRTSGLCIATLTGLLTFFSPHPNGARQSEFQREMQKGAVQARTAHAYTQELLSRDWKDWTAQDSDAILNYSS